MAATEELKAQVEQTQRALHEATIAHNRALEALARAEGNDAEAEWCGTYADAVEHKPGAHERFMALATERDARRIIAGASTIDDFEAWQRPRIAAEVARLTGAH